VAGGGGLSHAHVWSSVDACWFDPAAGEDVAWSDGSVAVFAGAAGDSVKISGSVSPASIEIKASGYTIACPGSLVLAADNTYTGGTTVFGGTLQVGSAANLGGVSARLTLDGGTLQATDLLDLAAPIVLNSGGGTMNSDGFIVHLTGAISGSGGLTVIDRGCGRLIVGGSNSYSGGTDIEGGTVQLDSGNALGDAAGSLIVNGTLNLNGNSASVGALSGNGAITDDATGSGLVSVFTVGVGGSQSEYDGAIPDGANGQCVALTKAGLGGITLAGANGYSGGTTVAADTLDLESPLGGTITVAAGAQINGSYAPPRTAISGLPPGDTPEGTEIPLQAGINGSEDAPVYLWTVTDAYGDVVETYSGPDYPFTPPDDGTYTVTLAAALPGVNVAAEFADISVSDVPPTASISGPATGVAGTEVDLTASALDPRAVDALMGFSYDWSVTKNDADFTFGYGPDIQFTPDESGTYAVSVTATDAYGVSSDPAEVSLTVTAAPSVVSIAASVPSAWESDQSPGEFTVTRDGDIGTPLTVGFSLSGGIVGTDYTVSAGSGGTCGTSGNSVWLTFNADCATATIEITPVDTGAVGGNLAVNATLDSNPDYVVASNYPSATVTIDYDDLPTVSIFGGGLTYARIPIAANHFTVSRNGPADEPLLVHYKVGKGGAHAVNGDDYQMLSGSALIAAGDFTAEIPITPIDKGYAGPDGSIELTLLASGDYNVSASADTAEFVLSNDDPPMVSISTVHPFCLLGSPAQFTVSLAEPVDYPLAVPYIISPFGVQIDSGTVNIAAGTGSATLDISLAGGSAQITLVGGETYTLSGGNSLVTANGSR
jgi:autotransporter-associated beta strand protein